MSWKNSIFILSEWFNELRQLITCLDSSWFFPLAHCHGVALLLSSTSGNEGGFFTDETPRSMSLSLPDTLCQFACVKNNWNLERNLYCLIPRHCKVSSQIKLFILLHNKFPCFYLYFSLPLLKYQESSDVRKLIHEKLFLRSPDFVHPR